MLESEKITTVKYNTMIFSWWQSGTYTYKRKPYQTIGWTYTRFSTTNPDSYCGEIDKAPMDITDEDILEKIIRNVARRMNPIYDYEYFREIKALNRDNVALADVEEYLEKHEDEIRAIDLQETIVDIDAIRNSRTSTR